MQKHTSCYICGSNNLKKLAGYYDRHELVKCKACGFVFMENIPSEEELSSYYSEYTYLTKGFLSPLTIKSFNLILDEFESYRKNGNILDVGCGRGSFLVEAKKRGWEVYGTEYSDTAIQLCSKNGIKMTSGRLSANSLPKNYFDVITSFEVIEHINNPVEELKNITSLLRKGGMFYCTTPNFNSLLRYYLKDEYNIIGYPAHLSYYTYKTLNRLFKDSGLSKVKFLTTGISLSRFKTSKKISTEIMISKESSDEMLRNKIEGKWYLGLMKRGANFLLTLFGLGDTLKGYYVKN